MNSLKQLWSRLNLLSSRVGKIGDSIEQLQRYSFQYNIKIIGLPESETQESSSQTASRWNWNFKSRHRYRPSYPYPNCHFWPSTNCLQIHKKNYERASNECMKLVKCRPIRSNYRPVVPWKASGYLITLPPCFSNSWRIQRNFKREMASSSAGPRTLLFIFDEPKILARSKSSATTTLWTLQIRRVYPWVKYLSQIPEQLTL